MLCHTFYKQICTCFHLYIHVSYTIYYYILLNILTWCILFNCRQKMRAFIWTKISNKYLAVIYWSSKYEILTRLCLNVTVCEAGPTLDECQHQYLVFTGYSFTHTVTVYSIFTVPVRLIPMKFIVRPPELQWKKNVSGIQNIKKNHWYIKLNNVGCWSIQNALFILDFMAVIAETIAHQLVSCFFISSEFHILFVLFKATW